MKLGTYQKIKKYENWLRMAYYFDCMRNLTTTQMDELIAAGKDEGIIYHHSHCPKCALEFVKKLAKPYFDFKQKMEDNKKKKEETEKENKEEITEIKDGK